MRIYLDSSVVIYLVEQVAPFISRLNTRLVSTDELVVSELTRLECRVKPIKESHSNLLQDYDDFFESAVSQIVELSRGVMEQATKPCRSNHRACTQPTKMSGNWQAG
jgi:predicted nucleic acid-binding protein